MDKFITCVEYTFSIYTLVWMSVYFSVHTFYLKKLIFIHDQALKNIAWDYWFYFYLHLNNKIANKLTVFHYWKYVKKAKTKASKSIKKGEYYYYCFTESKPINKDFTCYVPKQNISNDTLNNIFSDLNIFSNLLEFYTTECLKRHEPFLVLNVKNFKDALIINIYHKDTEKVIILTGDFSQLEFETCFKHYES